MHVQSRSQFADRIISWLGARQHGVVDRSQLRAAGITREQIAVRLEAGRLVEFHRGVYLVGAVAPPYAREMAALLACGEVPVLRLGSGVPSLAWNTSPMAILSHRSAGSLWDLLPYPAAGDVCIASAQARGATRPRITAHRATLCHRDIRRRHRMPLTSPPRTILDLAADLGKQKPTRGSIDRGASRAAAGPDPLAPHRLGELEQLVAQANYRKLASEAELRDQIGRNPRKPGVRALRAVLDIPGGPKRTNSPGERALLRLLRQRKITGYEVNAEVAGWEVDFLWRSEKLAVEVDGYDAHSGRVAFERDRLKAATLKANGISVMPVTGRQVMRDPDGVIARLLAALAAAG